MKNIIYLPLYSRKGGIHVQEKSGLNQWNANGRARDCYEVYIPVPKEVHRLYPGFFPDREHSFTLVLPNGEELSAKICQANDKALMSNPNADLGRWIIGELEERVNELIENPHTLITYEILQAAQVDSVRVIRESDYRYTIDVAPLRSYETQMGR